MQVFVGPSPEDPENPKVSDVEKMTDITSAMKFGEMSFTLPIQMTEEERENARKLIDDLAEQQEQAIQAAKLRFQEKLVEILGEHRHIYDVDCQESFGCSCGWTQQPDGDPMEMETHARALSPIWEETLPEDLFSRHLASEITKGLTA